LRFRSHRGHGPQHGRDRHGRDQQGRDQRGRGRFARGQRGGPQFLTDRQSREHLNREQQVREHQTREQQSSDLPSGEQQGQDREGLMEAQPRRILAAVDDLFFVVKISEAARRVGMAVDFVKDDRSLLQMTAEKPALIILDLNFSAIKPLQTISKLKGNPELKDVSMLGYVSHVQGELKQKAHDLGCDMVMSRSAFSQNLATLLRRHALR
jgi:PleD family two-component response regulator